jgi:hypothetical protein
MHRAVLLAFAVVAQACSAPTAAPVPLLDSVGDGPVRAVVLADSAVPGGAVGVRFENGSGAEYWFNPCERTVEKRVGDAWVSLGDEMRVCAAVAYLLSPNGERIDQVDVPTGLQPGTYRFRFALRPPTGPGGTVRPASSPFDID